MMDIYDLVKRAHENSRDKGFWEKNTNIPEKIALIHSEASEALEAYRDSKSPSVLQLGKNEYDENGKPVGFMSELADIVIRVADLAGYVGGDLDSVIREKMEYNATRPYMHGGKNC